MKIDFLNEKYVKRLKKIEELNTNANFELVLQLLASIENNEEITGERMTFTKFYEWIKNNDA